MIDDKVQGALPPMEDQNLDDQKRELYEEMKDNRIQRE